MSTRNGHLYYKFGLPGMVWGLPFWGAQELA